MRTLRDARDSVSTMAEQRRASPRSLAAAAVRAEKSRDTSPSCASPSTCCPTRSSSAAPAFEHRTHSRLHHEGDERVACNRHQLYLFVTLKVFKIFLQENAMPYFNEIFTNTEGTSKYRLW